MMPAPVKSARIGRGGYHADTSSAALVRTVSGGVGVKAQLERLEEEVARLQQELEKTRESAAEMAETRAAEAYAKGQAAGREQGAAEARGDVERDIARLGELFAALEAESHNLWTRCRDDIARLSLSIARKMVGSMADRYRELAVELALRCAPLVRDQVKLIIAVNPRDRDVMEAARERLMNLTEGVRRLEVTTRASIPSGSVVLETDAGQIDARVDEQFAALEAVLLPGWSEPENRSATAESGGDDGDPEGDDTEREE